MGLVQGSTRLIFCISRNNPVPGMVFLHGSGGQSGPGRSVIRMANRFFFFFYLRQLPSHAGLLSQFRSDLASKPNCPTLVSVDPAESSLQKLHETVYETLSNARSPYTRANYSMKWNIFSEWCLSMDTGPVACSVPLVLHFLQSQLDQGKAVRTVKIYAPGILVVHGEINCQPLGSSSTSMSISEGSAPLVFGTHVVPTKMAL